MYQRGLVPGKACRWQQSGLSGASCRYVDTRSASKHQNLHLGDRFNVAKNICLHTHTNGPKGHGFSTDDIVKGYPKPPLGGTNPLQWDVI